MHTVRRQIVEIPVEQLNDIDRMFGRMLSLDLENMPVKFQTAFDQTRETSFQNFTMKGVYESFEIDSIDEESIRLKNGVVLESKLMAEMFRHSLALVILVVTLHGYDEMDAAEDNMFRKLFLDNWGTAFIECGNRWTEQSIAMDLGEKGIYCTHSFSPGQNDIPLEMQVQIFQVLKPEEIGVALSNKHMMHPKKSVSGIFGIQTEQLENRIRPCDLCDRKATCPNAYDRLEK